MAGGGRRATCAVPALHPYKQGMEATIYTGDCVPARGSQPQDPTPPDRLFRSRPSRAGSGCAFSRVWTSTKGDQAVVATYGGDL